MTDSIPFDRIVAFLGVTLRILAAALGIYKITQFPETLKKVERAGLGFMSGAAILTSPLAFDPHAPTETWSPLVIYFGMILFLFGRTMRDRKHAIANKKAR